MATHILRLPDVKARIGVERSSIYAKLDPKSKQHDPSFPKPIRLGGRAVGWLDTEIIQWVEARIAERDAKAAGTAGSQHVSVALGKSNKSGRLTRHGKVCRKAAA